MRVYNKGKAPIVWSRTRKGLQVIHPGKYDTFDDVQAMDIIKKFPDAVSEAEYKKPDKTK